MDYLRGRNHWEYIPEENISKDADLHGFYCPYTQRENSAFNHVNYYIKLTNQLYMQSFKVYNFLCVCTA